MPSTPDELLRFTKFAVDNLSDAAYWLREDGQIIYVNDAATGLLGYTRDEFLEMHSYDFNADFDSDAWPEVWNRLKTARKMTFETHHLAKDGRIIPMEVAANYVEYGGKEYSCAFARDVSERKTMELRLREVEKMTAVGQLASGVAHDFNNQLAGIMGYADLLLDDLADDPPKARLAEQILVAVKRSADLTAKLLAFSRQGRYLSETVDMHTLLEEVVELVKLKPNKNVEIVTRLDAATATCTGDPTQLQNALLNLALNALDAMPAGGRLTLTTRNRTFDQAACARVPFTILPGEFIEIEVSDTGQGMDEVTRKRIFEPFFTTKDKGEGTGLGLSAVYGTVTSHNGGIDLESTVGQGTNIGVYLPLATSVPVRPTVPSATPGVTLDANVMVVDDVESLRDVARRQLERLGCQVMTFETGDQAISYFERFHEKVDLVVLDMIMPGRDGRGTFRAMRAIDPSVQVLLASGYSLDGEAQDLLDEGVRGFLQKPYSAADLAAQVAATLADL